MVKVSMLALLLQLVPAHGSMTDPMPAFVSHAGNAQSLNLRRPAMGGVVAVQIDDFKVDASEGRNGDFAMLAGLCSLGASVLSTMLSRSRARKRRAAGKMLHKTRLRSGGDNVDSVPPKRDVGVVLLSAGKGGRMKSDRPKQYLKLKGREMVLRSLDVFLKSPEVSEIVIVCAEEYRGFFEDHLIERPEDALPLISFAKGGKERQFSVMNGLDKITSEFVAVHDCARPLVTQDALTRVFADARKHGAALLGVPTKATIKVANGVEEPVTVATTPDRSFLWEAQTPQVMQSDLLRKGFRKVIDGNLTVTDDVSVLEALGVKVKLTLGEYTNLKLTTPEDVGLAEAILKEREAA